VLSPAAAAMHAVGDDSGLRNLLLSSSRLTFFLVTPCYLLAAAYLEPLISLLTGMESVPRETWWVGQVLLFAVFSSQLTNGCSKRVLMMCGDERRLLFISVSDAVANVILSVILAFKFGVLGVALGTMIPTTLVGWFWVVPLTIRRLKIPWKTYFSHHLQGTVMPMLVFSMILTAIAIWVPISGKAGLLELGWRGAACMLPLLFLGRKVIREMARP
jgi:O-antigen/teichoic acid export membrane protein